ncbi:hypothetical protein KFK09_002642 [Dendrobium nobile]|uniref:Uncharacterized protein n=1 Tax=Dendrobium nobile TaxID=94219 RepID=A0A8T3C7P3_DENNO|nr:hypothetical protein KFK09_002642 [Dendrobium nobile]
MFFSNASYLIRKVCTTALKHEVLLVIESFNKFWKASSPKYCSEMLLCHPEHMNV